MSEKESSRIIDELCDLWENSIRSGTPYSLEDYLDRVDEALRSALLRELLFQEQELLSEDHFARQLANYRKAFRDDADIFDEFTDYANRRFLKSTQSETGVGASQSKIGPYEILQEIGEGGMGVVYLAVQQDPVKRKVALKIIRQGLDSQQVIARFEAERQALALMDHSSIARILDAGTTESGQPFFAMELVDGLPLTEYCDQKRLSIRDRLDIFCQICDAVQHAHQKGIIHRDLKPTNILVTEINGRPIPKIIDFGLAKALETSQQLTDKTMVTELGQVLGTLKYMSPEQAGLDSLDIDTRSDIYTLGVILYELLTGSTPLDESTLRQRAVLQVLEMVREMEAERPSNRLSSTSATVSEVTQQRQIDAKKLLQILSGDLDWIVMKAIEKDRARRYETAAGFGADIRRFLAAEAVEARPPSISYQLKKFVTRNRGFVAGTLIALALFLAGTIGTSIGFYRADMARIDAENQKDRADIEAEKAIGLANENAKKATRLQLIVDYQKDRLSTLKPRMIGRNLFEYFVDQADPSDSQRLKQILSKINFTTAAKDFLYANIFLSALTTIESDFSGQPMLKAQLLESTALTMYDLGILKQAVQPLREAYEIYKIEIGPNSTEAISVMDDLGNLYVEIGQLDDGQALLQKALDIRQTHRPDDIDGILKANNNLASLAIANGDFARAERGYQAVLDGAIKHFGREDERTATAYANVGLAQSKLNKLELAENNLKTALDLRKKLLGESHSQYLSSRNNFAMFLMRRRKFDEAAKILQDVVARSRQALGDNDPTTLLALNNFGGCLMRQKRFKDAVDVLEDALAGRKKTLGEYHVDTASTLSNLSIACFYSDQPDLAMDYGKQSINAAVNSAGYFHPSTVGYIENFILVANQTKNYSEIVKVLVAYESLNRDNLKDMPPAVCADLLVKLGSARSQSNDVKEFAFAEANLRKAIGLLPESHQGIKAAKSTLILLYENWHKLDRDGGYLQKAKSIKDQLGR